MADLSVPMHHERIHRSGDLSIPRAAGSLQRIRGAKLKQAENESWIMIYLDIITLLLATFVLLLAHANQQIVVLEDQQIKPISASQPVSEDLIAGKEKIIGNETPETAHKEMALRLHESLLATDLSEDLKITVEPGRVNLQMPEQILFELGRAELKNAAGQLLRRLAPVLMENQYRISIEGHTDNIPIRNRQFPSNWELSSARSSIVLRYLAGQGVDPGRMRAVGYADTRPLGSNKTADGRGENRRVTLVIHIDN